MQHYLRKTATVLYYIPCMHVETLCKSVKLGLSRIFFIGFHVIVGPLLHKTTILFLITILYSRKIWWGIKFGGLVIYSNNSQIKIHQISYSHRYIWQSRNELPTLNPPIRLQWQFWSQLSNLISVNISGYTVITC